MQLIKIAAHCAGDRQQIFKFLKADVAQMRGAIAAN
jgi:hypothetical protein